MMTVIAVSAIIMIICATITASSISSLTQTSSTRAAMQSRAAADAGIDIVWASMEQGTFYCTTSATTASGLKYKVDVEYFDEFGAAVPCTGTSSMTGDPKKAVIKSEGTAKAQSLSAGSGNKRTVISLVDIEIIDNSVNLDKVFFSDAGYTVTNSTDVLDATGLGHADVYSNGTINCTTAVALEGSVYVQGDFKAHNKCDITGSVWAAGAVTSDDQLYVRGNVLSMGGTAASPTPVSLDKAWVGGTVVANGSVSLNSTANDDYCSVAGYEAKVCGGIVSIEGGISLSNGAIIAGNAIAKNSINLGTTNSNLMVGGNVISKTGSLLASNVGNSGYRVGGYVSIAGSSQVPKARIGNQASSCATGTTGFVACNPVNPEIPLSGLPAVLNFPTETRVIAPPRESLPRINSDALSLTKWVGYQIETVACNNVQPRVAAGWTGKLLLVVTGCTAPFAWNNDTLTLTGDLVIMAPAGIDARNDLTFKSNNTTKRTMQFIVPADAKLANGTTDLVNWTQPMAGVPDYYKPVCAAGDYGDFRSSKITTTNINMFIYTPCDFYLANTMFNFHGQIYSGSSVYPNNGELYYTPIDVPGAVTANSTPGNSITVTQTSRFDSRG